MFELAIANKADDNEVDEEEEEEEEVDQDELAFEQYQKAYQEDPQGELASKHPTHKWVMYRTVLLGYLDLQRLAGYTIPDALGMYITNDWHSYGLLELIDNQVSFLLSYYMNLR